MYLLISFVRVSVIAFHMSLIAISALAQTETQPDTDANTALTARAQRSLAILQPLLDLEQNLEEQIAELNTKDSQDDAVATELERLHTKLEEIHEQLSLVLAGVSERSYRTFGQEQFDLSQEVQNLIEPFILLLNEATNDARQLERTRRDLDFATRRVANTELAIANIEAAISEVNNAKILERLERDLIVWQDRHKTHETEVNALAQRITDLQSVRFSVGRNMNSAFEVFFRERGISLFIGIGSFLAVLIGARLVLYIVNQFLTRGNKEKTFAIRLGSVLFTFFSILSSFAAMLLVFNTRNDWLLLGLTMALFVAIFWVAIRMLPSLIEQLWVLLNLGAVQERERVLFHGVPYRVERLSFFTDLTNPALDGGEFTLPVRELVGMHSRPAAQDEAWFPSEKGDWVKLSDGNAGQVVAQTPEMVVVELLGGARVTYQTAEYLTANPQNLSHGFRVEIEFGIGYRHQQQSVDQIITDMREGVEKHFFSILAPSEIRRVDVEFLRAGASSLDYEVEVDVSGLAAHKFEELERELSRCLVKLANHYDWEIPFQQLVVHRP